MKTNFINYIKLGSSNATCTNEITAIGYDCYQEEPYISNRSEPVESREYYDKNGYKKKVSDQMLHV